MYEARFQMIKKKIIILSFSVALIVSTILVVFAYFVYSSGERSSKWLVDRVADLNIAGRVKEHEDRLEPYDSIYIESIFKVPKKESINSVLSEYCAASNRLCSEINLISANLFLHRKSKDYFSKSQAALRQAKRYFDSNPDVYPIRYEISRLLSELYWLRYLSDSTEVVGGEARVLLSKVKNNGGVEYDLASRQYKVVPDDVVELNNIYMALVATLISFSGDSAGAAYIFSFVLDDKYRSIPVISL